MHKEKYKFNDSKKKLNWIWKDNRTFKERLSLVLPLSVAIPLVFILFGIIDLYTSNMNSFNFTIYNIIGAIIITTILAISLLTFILLIPRGYIFDIFISLVFGIMIAGYLQGNFFNLSHGTLTGDAILWNNFFKRTIINTTIWVLIMFSILFLRYLKPKLWTNTIKFISIVLAATQIVTLPFIMKDALMEKKHVESFLSTKGLYDVALEDNTILIVLDRLDNEYLRQVLEDDPSFFDQLDGFTRFTNNTALYNHTLPSVCNMLTGYKYFFDVPDPEYFDYAWTKSDFIPDLRSEGYTTNFYMPKGYSYANIESLDKIADNIVEDRLTVDSRSLMYKLLELSAYRYSPDVFKPFLWTSTDQFQGFLESTAEYPPYIEDDYAFYQNLKQNQLSLIEAKKMFSYIHLHGSHSPYYIDQNIQLTDTGDVIGATKGSFKIVYEYLDQLKELGLYENANIIITGDHGDPNTTDSLSESVVTGLFVKESGNFGTPLKYNNAPVSVENLRPTILKMANIKYDKSAKTYFEVLPDDTNIRILYHKIWALENNPQRLLEYHIQGDANNFSNWTLVSDKVVPY